MNQGALKGLLICLVIFDHNEYAHKLFSQFLNGFSFHVVGFFALPFLRQADPFGKKLFEKAFFSYLYPYFWIVCGTAFISILLNSHVSESSFSKLVLALYSGNPNVLKNVTQMSLLWFLPSFVSLLLVRSFIDERSKFEKSIIMLAIVALHFLIGKFAFRFQIYIPLGLLPILYAIPLIFTIIFIHKNIFEKLQRGYAILISSIAFIIVKILQIRMSFSQELGFAVVADYTNITALIVNDLEAVVGTLMVFQLSRLNFGNIISECGRYSMQIYLFHAFIALAAFKFLETSLPMISMDLRLITSLLLTIVGSVFVAKFVMQHKALRIILFPKRLSELTALGEVLVYGKK
jgi:hypothetical protein